MIPGIDYQHKYLKYSHKYQIAKMTGGKKSDLDQIVSIANNVKILAMAEATHGQEKINQFRINVFKNLVKKCGYTVFVLEDQYSCCELINQYIKTGKGKPLDLVLKLMFFWGSRQMLDLIKWMRKYNMRHNNVLEFKGIDIQTVCNDYDGHRDQMTDFVRKKYGIYEKADQDNWVEADGLRDKSMFDVFMKFYDKSKKYFLYAHNFHLAKVDTKEGLSNAKWAGHYFAKKFGSQFYTIGNIFRTGSYLETPDLIETGIWYKWLRGSDNFIIVRDIPEFVGIDNKSLKPGLNIMNKNSPFDAIMVIDNETPLRLAKLY